MKNSLCFGVYDAAGAQVGFAGVIANSATFGWLCDVFSLEAHSGKGLGKWLVQTVVSYRDLQDLKSIILGTRNAHTLYSRHGGFAPLADPKEWMERVKETE
jgi:GNAT superfamily N-acetyltransferase